METPRAQTMNLPMRMRQHRGRKNIYRTTLPEEFGELSFESLSIFVQASQEGLSGDKVPWLP